MAQSETLGAPSLVVLTGAGISAESGIKTFRATDGLWENHPIEQVATPEAFIENPERVHRFYNARRQELKKVLPNPAHKILAELEYSLGGRMLVITQNIDNLHEAGGSKNVIHMHGELFRIKCNHCEEGFDWEDDLEAAECCPSCNKEQGLRPDIVWFGEMPYEMERIEHALAQCSVFVSIGTSGNVFPAAGFVLQAKAQGALCCEINTEASALREYFDLVYEGKASEQVPKFAKDFPKLSERKDKSTAS